MWNYLSGVKLPSESEKEKRKFESTKEYYKGYDKDKRARKYLPEWEKGRPWLNLEVCGRQGDGVYRVWRAEWYVCNWLYKL